MTLSILNDVILCSSRLLEPILQADLSIINSIRESSRCTNFDAHLLKILNTMARTDNNSVVFEVTYRVNLLLVCIGQVSRGSGVIIVVVAAVLQFGVVVLIVDLVDEAAYIDRVLKSSCLIRSVKASFPVEMVSSSREC